ncbi:unnamed protein product [Durusdinium trenchii]|uniref:Uncharacterized protein n=1 Tax=Durusdinium trenchii TaxID=1381693 RepID=A0ABP0L2C1_9DINO
MGPRRVRPKSDRGEQDETGGLRGGRGAEGKRRDPQGVYFLGDEEAFRMANEAAKLIGDGGYDVQGNPALQRQARMQHQSILLKPGKAAEASAGWEGRRAVRELRACTPQGWRLIT